MSQFDYSSDGEFATMIAAAAYAIKLEEKESTNNKKSFEGLGTSQSKIKSKKEGSMFKPTDSGKISISFSDKQVKEDEKSLGDNSLMDKKMHDHKQLEERTFSGDRFLGKSAFDKEIMEGTLSARKQQEDSTFSGDSFLRKTTFDKEIMKETVSDRKQLEVTKFAGDNSLRKPATFDKKMLEKTISDRKDLEEDMGMPSSIKKTPTFSDKYLNDTGNKRYGDGKEMKAGSIPSLNMKPQGSSTGKEKHGSMGSNIGGTRGDAWEKVEMDKTKKRYEKTNLRILEWEGVKKTKAKRRLERKERELDMRRAHASQEYHNEILNIDKIAGGARALADERKRKKESQILEKAKVIRATGKVPRKCFFF